MITTISAADLLKAEFPLAEEEMERNYRRGYADGWVEAVNAITDLFDGEVADRISERLYNHWTRRLMPWLCETHCDSEASPPALEPGA